MEHEQTIPEQRKEAETTPDSDTPDLLSTPAADEAAAAGIPRRRGRTTLLIAGAAALGVLAGAVTGYVVQYHREPTPLPPLAQKVVTPKALAPDAATTNKTINANRWHKTDDDLSKLLLEAPSGAKVDGAGYDSLDSFALNFERPDLAFRKLANSFVRRTASTAWAEDDRVFVEINLLQFKDFSGADDYQKDQSAYMPDKDQAGNQGVAIPGISGELGHAWVYSEASEKPGYYPIRQGRAIARRGNIVLDIHYANNRGKVSESDVLDLAKRQLERL